MTAKELIDIYISYFDKKPRDHKRISSSPLVPENDPTTLFTSSGMQPLVSYLLGETHPWGKRLVNVQNCFRAADIEEVGDNRHTTFFRMLGNWSLGGYFKFDEIPWLWEFLTKELKLPKEKLFISVFSGYGSIEKDEEAAAIWKTVLEKDGLNPFERIFYYGVEKNWWSRSGTPDKMPVGEIGGPDTEVFYDFGDPKIHEQSRYRDQKCHINCDCGRYLEIGNSVFMQHKKTEKRFEQLPQKNVDFGGGVERLLAAVEEKNDIFQTSLFAPIIKVIENQTGEKYIKKASEMRIIADHLVASVFIAGSGIKPSKNEQGYILRRLLRRSFDNLKALGGKDILPILHKIVEQYRQTDPILSETFEEVKLTILKEEENYKGTLLRAKSVIDKKYPGKEENGTKEISAEDAFDLYQSHGLSPSQIKSLGYIFDEQKFAQKMESHQKLSREGAKNRFKGGLADTNEQTVKGHTATHLLHRVLKDVLGEEVNQKGSNITNERIRFDFNHKEKLTDEQILKVEEIVREKIKENLKVSFEVMTVEQAKNRGAVGLFDKKYEDKVKVYSIGDYSKEICGGPHVNFTGELKGFKIIKQENIGQGIRRIYAKVE